MAEDAEPRRKPVKIGVLVGGGRPPGYCWNVMVLDVAHQEAAAIMDEEQHEHMREQVRELARQPDPTHSATVDVRPIDDFFEIRDKGGILRRLNIRVFFFVNRDKTEIVVLSVINKKNDGQTRKADRVRAKYRMRRYLGAADEG